MGHTRTGYLGLLNGLRRYVRAPIKSVRLTAAETTAASQLATPTLRARESRVSPVGKLSACLQQPRIHHQCYTVTPLVKVRIIVTQISEIR